MSLCQLVVYTDTIAIIYYHYQIMPEKYVEAACCTLESLRYVIGSCNGCMYRIHLRLAASADMFMYLLIPYIMLY